MAHEQHHAVRPLPRRTGAYLLHLASGIGVRHAIDLDCENDEHALRVVEELRDGRAMELWQRDRPVKSFPESARLWRRKVYWAYRAPG